MSIEDRPNLAEYTLTMDSWGDNWSVFDAGGNDKRVTVSLTLRGTGATDPIDLRALMIAQTGRGSLPSRSTVQVRFTARDVGAPTTLAIEVKGPETHTWVTKSFTILHGPSGRTTTFEAERYVSGVSDGAKLLIDYSRGPVPRLTDLSLAWVEPGDAPPGRPTPNQLLRFGGQPFAQISFTSVEGAILERLDHFMQLKEDGSPADDPHGLLSRFVDVEGSADTSMFDHELLRARGAWKQADEFEGFEEKAVDACVLRLQRLDTTRRDALTLLRRLDAYLDDCEREAFQELARARGLFGIEVEPRVPDELALGWMDEVIAAVELALSVGGKVTGALEVAADVFSAVQLFVAVIDKANAPAPSPRAAPFSLAEARAYRDVYAAFRRLHGAIAMVRRLAIRSIPLLSTLADRGGKLSSLLSEGAASDMLLADALREIVEANDDGSTTSPTDGFRRLVWAPLVRSGLILRSSARAARLDPTIQDGWPFTMAQRPSEAQLSAMLAAVHEDDRRHLAVSFARHPGRQGGPDYLRMSRWYLSKPPATEEFDITEAAHGSESLLDAVLEVFTPTELFGLVELWPSATAVWVVDREDDLTNRLEALRKANDKGITSVTSGGPMARELRDAPMTISSPTSDGAWPTGRVWVKDPAAGRDWIEVPYQYRTVRAGLTKFWYFYREEDIHIVPRLPAKASASR